MADDLIQFNGGVLVADMVQEASTDDSLELTQFPIESGASISDHAIHKPSTLELTLVQTETPIAAIAGFRVQTQERTYQSRARGSQTTRVNVPQKTGIQANVGGLITAVTNAVGLGPPKVLDIAGMKSDGGLDTKTFSVSVLAADSDVARVNDFHDALLELKAAVLPLVVTVKGQTYVDMIITSVKRTDPQSMPGGARFGVSLQQIQTVETQTVELPPVPEATAKVSRGPQFGPPPPPPNVQQKTLALQALIGVGALSE